jgi:transcriptional antiterminator RfaH
MYWVAVRAQPRREALAAHFLGLAGYTVYLPRLRERRTVKGRKVEIRPPLFPGYLFAEVIAGWWAAHWCPATHGLVMSSGLPLRVPARVLDEIRGRERGGLIELPKPPLARLGSRVRVTQGPLAGHVGLYAGMKPRERVEVLLAILGSSQRVTLAADAVEAVP